MEQNKLENRTKEIKKQNNFTAVRISSKVQKKLSNILSKANKKDYGKRVLAMEIIESALDLIQDHHIKKLQENSLSNTDRLEIKFREYVKKNGKISKDDFLGILMNQSLSA